jgi:hypothetical protein
VIFEQIEGWRIVAKPAALDSVAWPADATTLRLADDDVLLIADLPATERPAADGSLRLGSGLELMIDDVHAIVEDDAGWAGCWITAAKAAELAVRHIHWRLPPHRPALAQGLIAGIPAKLWLEETRALILVAGVSAGELQERLA